LAPEVKGGGYGYFLSVQGEAKPRAPFNHAGAARRTRIVRKRASRWSTRCLLLMGLLHRDHLRLRGTTIRQPSMRTSSQSLFGSQNGASEILVAPQAGEAGRGGLPGVVMDCPEYVTGATPARATAVLFGKLRCHGQRSPASTTRLQPPFHHAHLPHF
jgi:hypothetical protein